jgi:hypothetical protein
MNWSFTPIIPATWDVIAGGSQFKISLHKVSNNPILETRFKTREKEGWSTAQVIEHLACIRLWVRPPVPPKINNNNNRKRRKNINNL